MTLIGTAYYMQHKNDDLFKRLILPDGINKMDFENSLLLRAGEMEVLFSDPDFFAEGIGVWGKKWYRTFEKWITALNIEYAPLENYDRMEDWTETENIDEETTDTITRAEDETLTTESEENGTQNTNDSTESNTDSTTTNTVSAFNSSAYEPDSRSVNDTDTTTTVETELTTQNTVDETVTKDNDITENRAGTRDNDRLNRKTGRAHGNIGVTTSQQMLEAELDIAKWNLYDKMSDIFILEFLIPVY